MAQEQPIKEEIDMKSSGDSTSATASNSTFKLNVHAPEFVPKAQTPVSPVSGYYYPCFHYIGGSGGVGGSNWLYAGDQDSLQFYANPNVTLPNYSKNFLTDDLRQKIVKQAEFQFGDMSLLASETLAKHMNKDPEGYVPLSVIASSKKIKSLVSNNHLLAQALRTSSKLVVSEDGKKVRRKHSFTERDKEDLQCRVVVAENLPEDYSHHNLEKIFGVVGSVKTVRICHPQDSNTSRSKGDVIISNKLHALVEYETVDQAEKAVEKLNDERNWRKGLRVRMLLRRTPRSVIRGRKDYDHFDSCSDEDDIPPAEPLESSSQLKNTEVSTESNAEDNASGSKKGWPRNRGKARGRGQSHNNNNHVLGSPSANSSSSLQSDATNKQHPRGPRMPDGTRGFTMGRGKPASVMAQTSSSVD